MERTRLNKQELIDFETEIKDLFLAAKIRAPIHLSGGNEDQLIKIFQDIKPEDWVFSTHRSHYHALLKGISPVWLREEILGGRSISIHNTEYKFFSSAIVGGIMPIALGVAMGIKMKQEHNRVWVFVGDMAAETGVFNETTKYAERNSLPMSFIIEDNLYSVNTRTLDVWGLGPSNKDIKRYIYIRLHPHVGVGKFVEF